jgi:transcriptional regulator with XRE-family HTH domain
MPCHILGLVSDGGINLVASRRLRPLYTPTYIRAWRERAGLTQDQLAERIGTTHGTLSKIESGQQPYGQRLVDRIAAALDIHPAQLLWGDPKDESSIWRIAGQASRLTEAQRKAVLRVIEALYAETEVSD